MNFAKILKSKKVIFGILVALGIASIFVFGGENGGQILTVERGEIVQEVAATGKVKPARSVDLGFDKSGRVAIVRASVGDFVRAGETITSFSSL